MTDALSHRGPDGDGMELFGAAGLAHRRLAIIDLAGGKQPLRNEDGTLWITFNGEIYNYKQLRRELEDAGHRFRTNSDTETILHGYEEWGERIPEKLRGMFAFAIWNRPSQELFLARDRLGIKPLVYWHRGSRFDFASELSAFQRLASPPTAMDPAALDWYLELQYIPGAATIFSGVRKLEPGTFLRLDRTGRAWTGRYWEIRFEPDRSVSERDAAEALDEALRDSVRHHMIADVPVGTLLSGGLDSSLVTAYAASTASSQIQSFTIGHYDTEFDESPRAERVARAFAIRHHLEFIEQRSDAIVPTLVRHYGEPFADSSAVPTWNVSEMARRLVKVVLSGDGGDESFAGYPWLAGALERFHFPASTAGVLARRLGDPVLRMLRGRVTARREDSPLESLARSRAVFSRADRRRLWRSPWGEVVAARPSLLDLSWDEIKGLDLCSQIQWMDMRWYLPGDILTKVDVASMAHGLEVRVPLLDHHVVEVLARLPAEMKVRRVGRRTVTKFIAKMVAARYLDNEVVHGGKKGFALPTQRWFSDERRTALTASILAARPGLGDIFDSEATAALLRQDAGGTRLWTLWVLAAWLEAHPRAVMTA